LYNCASNRATINLWTFDQAAAWQQQGQYCPSTGRNSMKEYSGTPERITGREFEVIQLIAQGMTDRQIATTLCISYRTAQNHAKNIREKTGMRTRTGVVMYALHHHLLSLKNEYF
jgi:DNA-binding NarL/FixJ family response regulator